MSLLRWVRGPAPAWAEATVRYAIDVVAGVAVTSVAVLMRPPGSPTAVWFLAAALGMPLAVRRRWPAVVLATVIASGVVALVVGLRADVVVYAIAYALYPVVLSRRSSLATFGALAGVLTPGLVDAIMPGLPLLPADPGDETFSTTPVTAAASCAAVIGAAWCLATVIRGRRQHAAQLAALRTEQAVVEERLRIARDIHDVVGHNLSLIAMKAAVANQLGTDRATALDTIEQVSRTALDQVRTVLTGIRDLDPPDVVDLDGLIDRARAAGLAVTVDRSRMSALPAGLRISAYRILQEALTNARRHATTPRCHVRLAIDDGALTITVVNDAPPRTGATRPGHGLLGMRERVTLHGGTLTAGMEPDNGFAVRATLPLPT